MKAVELTLGCGTTRIPLRDDGTSGFGIYEVLDADGNVLYTGRTSEAHQRMISHSRVADWWPLASTVRWTPVANYAEAVALERVGISADHGEWNVVGHRDLEATTNGRLVVPGAMRVRLVALYAATRHGKSADLDNYIATARALGWTLQSIADALAITGEAVRLHQRKGVIDHDLVVPTPPARAKAGYRRRRWPMIPRAMADEMRELQAAATRVRGSTPLDHPNRRATERLSELIAEARLRGVRYRDIAEVLGVTAVAVQLRLGRHGYVNNPPSQPAYRNVTVATSRAAS